MAAVAATIPFHSTIDKQYVFNCSCACFIRRLCCFVLRLTSEGELQVPFNEIVERSCLPFFFRNSLGSHNRMSPLRYCIKYQTISSCGKGHTSL